MGGDTNGGSNGASLYQKDLYNCGEIELTETEHINTSDGSTEKGLVSYNYNCNI